MFRLLPLFLLLGALPVRAETLASAHQFRHDPAACPDLSGVFVIPTSRGDKAVKLQSGRDQDGTPTLTIFQDDGTPATDRYDGVAQPVEDGSLTLARACEGNALQISVTKTADGTLVINTVMALDADSNLVLSSYQPPKDGERAKQGLLVFHRQRR